VLSLSGILLIAHSCFSLSSTGFPGWSALEPVAGSVLVMAAGPDAWLNKTVLSRKWMVFIGLISYPLYLWHWPVLVFVRQTTAFSIAPRLTALVAVAASVLLSVATYRLLELRVQRQFRVAREGVVLALCGSMVTVAVIGSDTALNNGFVTRYPASVRALLNYGITYNGRYWVSPCYLSKPAEVFPAECGKKLTTLPSSRRLVVWGDSHAAMLVQSLSHFATRRGVAVAQFTSGRCAPVIQTNPRAQPWCNDHVAIAAERIAALAPATVVLAASWMSTGERKALNEIPATVRRLRAAGVKRIVLVGPEPDWHKPLPVTIARFMRDTETDAVPSRMTEGLTPGLEEMDKRAEAVADEADVEYVSPLRAFCNRAGCMTTVPGDSFVLTAWDTSHLTKEAAAYLVSAEMNDFFSGP
jgi:hypothetical protein